jgi:hypothetical protein
MKFVELRVETDLELRRSQAEAYVDRGPSLGYLVSFC